MQIVGFLTRRLIFYHKKHPRTAIAVSYHYHNVPGQALLSQITRAYFSTYRNALHELAEETNLFMTRSMRCSAPHGLDRIFPSVFGDSTDGRKKSNRKKVTEKKSYGEKSQEIKSQEKKVTIIKDQEKICISVHKCSRT